jgi:CheY-like chemotaxis protein
MKSVLLTDDNADTIELVQLFLKNSGCRFISARDGVEAVDICMTQKPDLMLMDLKMPRMNGYGATTTLRTRGFINASVVVTASESAEDRNEANAAGVNGYILKTMDMQDVETTIDSFLQRGGQDIL